MSLLTISLLGPFRVARDGQPVTAFHADTARALLAYLAMDPGVPHRREALAGLLWPDQPEPEARHNLSQALNRVHQAISECPATDCRQAARGHSATADGEAQALLQVTREAIEWNAARPCWLDVAVFCSAVDATRRHPHRHVERCDSCLRRLAEAAEVYRGDLLTGFSVASPAFEQWLVVEREGLHQDALEVLGHLAAHHERCGECEEALRYARRQLELEPWLESAHRQAMRALALSGQRGAALAQYEACRRALAEELGVDPEEETRRLYERLLQTDLGGLQDLRGLAQAPPHNLAAPLTPFVGRKQELEEIDNLLQDPNCRLLTLVGPGGIGKTRLALEAARAQIDVFADGVFFVPLAPLTSVEAVAPTVAQAIGLTLSGPTDPEQQVVSYLRQREMLLVLDNCEHLFADDMPARPEADRGVGFRLITDILQNAPAVKLLVTSRARLNMHSEHRFAVQGMRYPALTPGPSPRGRGESDLALGPSPGGRGELDVAQYSAVELFLQSAERVRPGHPWTMEDRAQVGEISRLVEGMPLALLLAASWMDVLAPGEIAQQVRQGIGFLEADLHDLPERQRSMQAVFDASWRMLTEHEQAVFAALAVFRGGFTAEAAQAVAGADLRALRSLAHKSFVEQGQTGRYRVHELLRQYGEDKLVYWPEERDRALDRHCEYYAEWLARLDMMAYELSHVTPDVDNLRQAWRRAVSQGRWAEVRKLAELCAVYERLGWFQEAESTFGWAADVLRASQGDGERDLALGVALNSQGRLFRIGGNQEKGAALVREAQSLLRAVGAGRELALCNLEAVYAGIPNDGAQERELLQEGLAICLREGDEATAVGMLSALAAVAIRQGAYDDAEQYSRDTLRMAQEMHYPRLIALGFRVLGGVAYGRGDYATASQHYAQALALMVQIGYRNAEAWFTTDCGDAALGLGKYEEARRYHLQALAIYGQMDLSWGRALDGARWGTGYSLNRLAHIASATGDRQEALQRYREALRLALDTPNEELRLDVVLAQAVWLLHEEQRERAVELLALVLALAHPQSMPATRRDAQKLLDRLRNEAEPEVLAAAEERGRARDLQATVAALLAELEEREA